MGPSRASYGEELCHQQTHRVQVFEILQRGVLMRRKEEEQEHTSETSHKNHLMPVNMALQCNQLCSFFAVKNGVQNNMPVRLDQEEVTAQVHHRLVQLVTACSLMQRMWGWKNHCNKTRSICCTNVSRSSALLTEHTLCQLVRKLTNQICRRLQVMRVIPGRTHIGALLHTFVLKDQGSMCVELLVPTASLMVETAWVRNWDVNHENVNHILKGWKSSL